MNDILLGFWDKNIRKSWDFPYRSFSLLRARHIVTELLLKHVQGIGFKGKSCHLCWGRSAPPKWVTTHTVGQVFKVSGWVEIVLLNNYCNKPVDVLPHVIFAVILWEQHWYPMWQIKNTEIKKWNKLPWSPSNLIYEKLS